ncbi:MAG: conjugal transfer protein TraX [Gorillibacterium sp.]|nr:conjugal transfer protein TraX [Gorillibacterium sp.]
MQLLAMITMLIDHAGYMFFPELKVLRWIGRIAMPLYAYGIAMGYLKTTNLKRYIQRLVIIAALSQIPYTLAFHTWTINIVGTFIFSLGVLWTIKQIPPVVGKLIILAIAVVLLELFPFEYGSFALILILIYSYTSIHWMLTAHVGLNLLFFFYKGWMIGMASAASTALLSLYPDFAGWGRKLIPRWLWLGFYPAHLLILVLIREVILYAY